MEDATYHILVKGKVQGVFFRASAKDQAVQLRLKGWVRNTEAGEVEAVVAGQEEACKEFIEWCNHGPINARVEDVIVTPADAINVQGFSVKRG